MRRPCLLVSVRDAAEAVAALAGGADLIDVKEPTRGPLGRADAGTIAAVVQSVGGRAPVSAALGEVREWYSNRIAALIPAGLSYVKWGLGNTLGRPWARLFSRAAEELTDCQPVPVAYADWVRAGAPRPADVVAGTCALAIAETVLIDTFQKDGSNLTDWLSVAELTSLVETCRGAGVKVAVAGSLTAAEIDRLRDIRPDWFAVRSAACDGGRDGTVSERQVRELADLVHAF